MRSGIQMILAAALACASTAAWTQTSPLESRMGEARFNAAGLHKLDAAELRSLEQWIASQTVAARDPVDDRMPGRHDGAGARLQQEAVAEPVNSTLVGRFDGFARGREFTLANGQVWKQVSDIPLQGVRSEAPAVEISPARLGGWWLRVVGYNTRVRVERIR